MMDKALELLKKYFGYDEFRIGQQEAINYIINKKDTLVIMPTGGGKSLCYQIPALMFKGLTIVISPLISLMKDQVDALIENGIDATYINGTLDNNMIQQRIKDIISGKYKLLYLAPERLHTMDIYYLINQVNIDLVAIDEAHCISQWGHDFRPSYIKISEFINKLINRPAMIALTATATPQVQSDICDLLCLNNPSKIVTGYNRENLYFGIKRDVNKRDFIKEYVIAHKEESGIIYCSTRKEVESTTNYLNSKGINAVRYHAGLDDDERSLNQEDFLYDRANVIVATNAFGMGIDKSNVRYVIHHNMPKSIEDYYQEAGRAGRDGLKSECILLFKPGDVRIHKFFIEESLLSEEQKNIRYKKLQAMVDYCHTSSCLRRYILKYFGDNTEVECNMCSECNDERELADITIDAQKVFSCVYRMNQRFGSKMVADVLAGSANKRVLQFNLNKIKTYGIMRDKTIKKIQQLILFLIADGYLHMTEEQYPVIKLTNEAVKVIKGEEKVFRKIDVKVKKKVDNVLFEALRDLRKEISQELDVPPYMIFHDSTLKEMSSYMPESKAELFQIKGVGENKYKKYGEKFLELITNYIQANPEEYNKRTKKLPIETENNNSSKHKNNDMPSHQYSLLLYNKGLSVEEIANERNIKPITIEGHLFKCFEEGMDIDVNSFIPNEFREEIFKAVENRTSDKLRPIKEQLPKEVTYAAIKAAIAIKNEY